MALTEFQRRVLRLLADRRRSGGESYIAGGVALSIALDTHRVSRDVDLFHDTAEAVTVSFEADRGTLADAGYGISVLRHREAYVEAEVSRDGDRVLVEWARDTAFRFFPLVEHSDLGLTLHPFDLATNKVLALVGRLEVRDWIDVLACDERLQPLGLLAWAACGKDPGFSPHAILEHAARTARYTDEEISALDGWDAQGLKALASAAVSEGGVVVALFSTDPSRVFIVARAADATPVDAGRVVRELTTKFGGRGGGMPDLAQGGGLTAPIEERLVAARDLLGRA